MCCENSSMWTLWSIPFFCSLKEKWYAAKVWFSCLGAIPETEGKHKSSLGTKEKGSALEWEEDKFCMERRDSMWCVRFVFYFYFFTLHSWLLSSRLICSDFNLRNSAQQTVGFHVNNLNAAWNFNFQPDELICCEQGNGTATQRSKQKVCLWVR